MEHLSYNNINLFLYFIAGSVVEITAYKKTLFWTQLKNKYRKYCFGG